MKYYFRAFRNYAKCDGRATRKEFWLFLLFHYLFTVSFVLIDAYFVLYFKIVTEYYVYYFNYGYLTLIYSLVSACPAICLQVRRLHDVGKSGGWWWAKNVPILSWYVFYLNCKAGDPRINIYGYPANYTPASAFDENERINNLNQIRFCCKCNHRLPDDSEFCQYCGAPIPHNKEIYSMENNKIVADATESSESSQITKTTDESFTEAPRINQTVETLTERIPAEVTQPVQQPQIINVVEPISTNNKKAKKKKVRYCSRCGSLIDNETRQCTGCGKKYFKGIRFNKVFFIVLSFSLVLLMAISFIIYQCNEIAVLEKEKESMQNDINTLNIQNGHLEETVSDLKKDIKKLEGDASKLKSKLLGYEDIGDFVNDNVVFIEDDGTKLYHKYECYKFKGESFWVYNTEAAIYDGYKKCSICHWN